MTKAQARTRTRARIRDTTSSYEFSDATLDTYVSPILKEIATGVRSANPDWYLRSHITLGYTQARDPVASDAYGGFEHYDLPPSFSAFRWAERLSSSGAVQYLILEVGAAAQEGFRHGNALGFTRVAVPDGAGGTTTYNLSPAIGRERISIQGRRFRIVPPPASEMTIRVWFDATPVDPVGESETLDIPDECDEALVRAWARSVLEDGGDPAMAAVQEKAFGREMATATMALRRRSARSVTLGRVF